MIWRDTSLGEGIEIKHGFALKGKHFSDVGKYIVLTPGNFFENGGFRRRPGKDRYYAGDIPEDYVLAKGDLVVAMTEQGPGLLGSSALIPEDDRFLHNQRLGLVRCTDDDLFSQPFLYWLLNSKTVRQQISSSASGTKVRHTSPTRIYRVKVRVPPIATQDRICRMLSRYDDLIENNRRRIQLLEQSARLLYKEWFVHLRFPGHESIRVIDGVPEGWKLGVVSDFYDTASGGTPSRKNPSFFGGENYWVKTRELRGGYIFSTKEKISDAALAKSAAKIFPRKTVLVAMYGATVGQVGILAIDAATNQACCAVFPKDFRANYIHAFLFFRESEQSLRDLAQGAAQTNVSQEVIRRFSVLMPSERIMHSFLGYAEPVLDQIRVLEASNLQLRAARDLLLPRLMNGEITV